MAVENIMYFALGFLAAGFLAVAILPAIWNRAVRLTRRRIEAATPVTLSEFRADKDKLRAEFAISLRKLEMRVDMLRERLTARIVELDAASHELMALRTERDEQYDAIGALKVREQELVSRIRDLERDGAALAASLRQSGGEFIPFDAEETHEETVISADQLSGDYRNDVEDLLTALNIERQRNSMLEEQARLLLSRIEKKRKSGLKDEAIAMLRDTLNAGEDDDSAARVQLRKAEQRISSAENRLSALLMETEAVEQEQAPEQARTLADRFSQEDQLSALEAGIHELEETTMRDWNSERFDVESLRARLQTIASDVSQIVYAADSEDSSDLTESLFDKVRKFAADGLDMEDLPRRPEPVAGGPVAERMAALRDMQAR